MKVTLNLWTGSRNMTRIYINLEDQGNRSGSVGFIERRMVTRERSGRGYYDRHRMAKGDMDELISDVVTLHCDPDYITQIDEWTSVSNPGDDGVDRWNGWVGFCANNRLVTGKAKKRAKAGLAIA
jgi:hypothetical protein